MELLAATAVALLGYYSSMKNNNGGRRRGKRGSYADLNDATEQNDTLPTDFIKQYTRDSEARWNQARVPKVSGIITPDTRPAEIMPFFKSAKTQNTNTSVKQRKMELFTGNLLEETSETGAWKHKVEAPNMFGTTAQGVVTSGGGVGNPQGDAELDKARMIQSKLQNNVLPAEQLRVGPGMAVGPDVAATGGFHQFYRQLPLNVNEYKLTQLPGRANHGASSVQKPEAAQMVTVNHHPGSLNWTLDDRPLMATQASVLAQSTTQSGDVVREFAGLKPLEKDYRGIKGMSETQAPQETAYDDQTRGRVKLFESDDISNPIINRTGARAGLGGYLFSTDTTLKPWSQRGQSERPTAGPKAAIPGPQMAAREMRSTARQNQNRALTNPAGRMNVFNLKTSGKVGLKKYPRYDALEHTVSKAPVQVPTGTDGVNVRNGSKKVLRNPWLDESVVAGQRTQNERNPYAHDVSKCGTGADHPLPQFRVDAKPWTPTDGQQIYPPWAS
jgi:hypothetical protein